MSAAAWRQVGLPPVAPRVQFEAVDPETGIRLVISGADGRWYGTAYGKLAGFPVTVWISEDATPDVCSSRELMQAFLVQSAAELTAAGMTREYDAARP